jgi:hypothetical protein
MFKESGSFPAKLDTNMHLLIQQLASDLEVDLMVSEIKKKLDRFLPFDVFFPEELLKSKFLKKFQVFRSPGNHDPLCVWCICQLDGYICRFFVGIKNVLPTQPDFEWCAEKI